LQRAGKLTEAEQLCLGILHAAPEFAPAHHLLAMIQLQQGRAADALTSVEAALAMAETPAILASHAPACRTGRRKRR
jgi:predicted Zn-dependent protease